MRQLQLRNRQRNRTTDLRVLRRIVTALLDDLLAISDYELGIHLVSAGTIARINEQFLHHKGPTDVISFDFREGYGATTSKLSGEIYICIQMAEEQACEFKTSREEELIRYVVHGVLHLQGY